MMTGTAGIEVSGIWKRFSRGAVHHTLRDAIPAMVRALAGRNGHRPELREGEFWALKDVSFEVNRGETLGIIGPNGAGKSTLLKILSGISRQTRGTIRVRGRLAALIEVGAGFHPDLTGRENVFLNGTILGLKRREIRALFDKIVAFSELESFIDMPVKRYSSGMYVRLGFAIAAHIDPDVFLIDEVLAVGDLAFRQKCYRRIHELKQAGKTILFISHNLGAVEAICDRATLLAQGEVAKTGDVVSVIGAYREQVMARERRQFQRAEERGAGSPTLGGGVHIEGVRVVSGGADGQERCRMGGPVTVEVAYRCLRRIERPTVKVTLERTDGLLCHVASTEREGVVIPPLDGCGVLQLTYPAMNLTPQTYRIGVEIGEAGRRVPLDSRRFAGFLTLTADRPELGVVRLEHRWGVEPEEASWTDGTVGTMEETEP